MDPETTKAVDIGSTIEGMLLGVCCLHGLQSITVDYNRDAVIWMVKRNAGYSVGFTLSNAIKAAKSADELGEEIAAAYRRDQDNNAARLLLGMPQE